MRKRVQQQHDGVVVMEWQFSDRASPSSRGGGEVLGRGGAAPWRRRRGVGEGRGCALDVVLQPSLHPSIYREKGEGGRPPLDEI